MYSVLLLEKDKKISACFANIIQQNFAKEIRQIKIFDREEQLLSYVEDYREAAEIIVIGMTQRNLGGIEVAQRIKRFREDAQVIFMSDSSAYNPLLYEVEHIFYLKKPLDEHLVCKAIRKAKKRFDLDEKRFFTVYTKSQIYRIRQKKIVYVEKEKRLTHIVTDEGERISYYCTFDEIFKNLNQRFYRCHNSYIINLSFVRTVGGGFVEMENGVIIPVSRSKMTELKTICAQKYGT